MSIVKKPDWNYWQQKGKARAWALAALALDIEPRSAWKLKQDAFESIHAYNRYKNLETSIRKHFKSGFDKDITYADFIGWADHSFIGIPNELRQLITPIEKILGEEHEAEKNSSDRINKRHDDLGYELDIILTKLYEAGFPLNVKFVMAKFRSRAGTNGSCVQVVEDSAIIWVRGSTGGSEKCNYKALNQRIKRWRTNNNK